LRRPPDVATWCQAPRYSFARGSNSSEAELMQ
jgi:hypothetical protein